MKRLSLHSLWFKCFICVFIFIILPILVISYSLERYQSSVMLEQKRLSDLKDMDTLSLAVNIFLDSIESTGIQLAQNDIIKNQFKAQTLEPSFTHLQDEYSKSTPNVCHFSLMAPSGVFPYEDLLNRSRLFWFYNITFPKNPSPTQGHWSNSLSIEYQETGETSRVISYLYPCYDEEVFLGYLVLFIDTKRFEDFLLSFSDNTYILEDERVFASRKNIPFYTKLFQLYNINYGDLKEDKSVILQSSSQTYVVTTMGYARLGLKFITMTSYEELKESVVTAYPSLYQIAVYGTIFAFLSAYIIARFLTKPIYQLKKVIKYVTLGDFNVRYENNGKDEIAELGRTFNTLLNTIQELFHSLDRKHKEQEQYQMQLIQEQIKPHFLYNMLETINSMIRSNMKDESIQIVNHLAVFYRISLNNGSNIIQIAQEIQLSESYLNLQKNRYIEFMDYVLAFSPAIYQYSIPKLTLQPIIENAIYHGLKEKCEKGILCVSGYIENGRIIFEVYDTGCGMTKERILEIQEAIQNKDTIDNHFGLASVIKRLNYYCNNLAKLTITSELNHYTCITVSFPVQNNMPLR